MSRELPQIQLDSVTWRELKQFLSAMSVSEITKLKNPIKTIEETNVIRGSLLVIDQILGLEDKIIKSNQQAF